MRPATLDAIPGLSTAQARVVQAIDHDNDLTLESAEVDQQAVLTVRATVDLTGRTLTWRFNEQGEPLR